MKKVYLLARSIALCQLIIVIGLMMGCNPFRGNPVSRDERKIISNGRNDAWYFVGAGGGGAMFYPAVSPHNPDFAFVSCDMTGSYVTYNGGNSWRMFNLRGVVRYYVFDPIDSNTIYANSIALFKSIDRGNTWVILFPDSSEITGFVSKGDHAEELIGTRDSTLRNVLALAVDPANSRKLYAAISIDHRLGFYISNDGGSHWTLEKKLDNGVRNIFVHPSSPKENRTIYITGKNTITVRENGNWKIKKGPKDVEILTEFAGGFDLKKNKFIIYSISGKSYFNPKGDKSGIYYTEDAGKTWENRQDGLLELGMKSADLPEWRSVATSALHPEVIYVSYNNLRVHNDTTCIGVAKSQDYGKTWKLSWKDRLTKGGDIPSENFALGWIDERYGPTWGENPFSIGVSPTNPDVCYCTDFGRTVKTSDGGRTWEQVYTQKKQGGGWISRGLEVNTGYSVVFDPFDWNHIFITYTDIGLMESKDGGESWESGTKDNGIPRKWINSTYWLAFDPEVKGKAWTAMSDVHDLPRPKMWRRTGTGGFTGGVLVTENGGKTWKPISANIGEAAITHILIDPESRKGKRTLYACAFGKGVYKSLDGGKTWKQKNKGIPNKEPLVWRIVRRDKDGALFLIVIRRSEDGSIGNENDGALYKSIDGAESWKPVSLPAGTNGPTSLAVDPETYDRLILSAWGRSTGSKFSPDTGGGIFLSKDDGKTWLHVIEKDQHIHDITIDPRNNTYFACGFNGSAYRSTDHGESWKRIKGYNFKWGKRVDFDPRNPDRIFIVTYGGGIWFGPAKGDENAVDDIVLSMKKR